MYTSAYTVIWIRKQCLFIYIIIENDVYIGRVSCNIISGKKAEKAYDGELRSTVIRYLIKQERFLFVLSPNQDPLYDAHLHQTHLKVHAVDVVSQWKTLREKEPITCSEHS